MEVAKFKEPWPYAVDPDKYECEECGHLYCIMDHLGGPWWETTCKKCGHINREYRE